MYGRCRYDASVYIDARRGCGMGDIQLLHLHQSSVWLLIHPSNHELSILRAIIAQLPGELSIPSSLLRPI